MAQVLVIDEDPMVGTVLEMGLVLAGHQVRLARSAAEAIALATKPVDIVLVEYDLTHMHGEDLCALLREKGRRADLPVIMTTVRNSSEVRRAADAIGALALLRKPFHWAELIKVIGERAPGASRRP